MALKNSETLVSLADAKRYLSIADVDTDNDRLLDALVAQASLMVKDEMGCDIIKTTYANEIHSAEGGNYLWLDNYPLIEIDRVAINTDVAFTAKYTGSGSHATVEVTPDNRVRLRYAESGVWNVDSFATSDSTTVTALSVLIDAVDNWAVQVTSSFGDYPATEVLPAPPKNARNIWVDLEVPEPNETGVNFEIANADWSSLYNPLGWDGALWDRSFGSWGNRIGDGLSLQGHGHGFRGVSNIFIAYTAGYLRSAIPKPIQSAVLELVSVVYNLSKKDPSLKSEKIGDYSYSIADRLDTVFSSTGVQSTSNLISTKLRPYKRNLVFGA